MAKKTTPVTVPTGSSVDAFLAGIEDERKRQDSEELRALMESITGETAAMWGPSIVGFGSYHYRYESGHEGDAPAVSFSPRKANLTIYITGGFDGRQETLDRLGKYTLGKVCLHIKRLDDIDRDVLKELVQISIADAERFNVEP
jgi:hypothetical protein